MGGAFRGFACALVFRTPAQGQARVVSGSEDDRLFVNFGNLDIAFRSMLGRRLVDLVANGLGHVSLTVGCA